MTDKIFKSSYFLRALKGDFNPFTPNVIVIGQNHVEYRRRNWYLISVDIENLNFQNIAGISIDKHLFGSTIKIKSTGSDPIYVHGFWKSTANQIKQLCSNKSSFYTQKSSNELIVKAISKAVGDSQIKSKNSIASELRELKELVVEGIISQEEFDKRKKKIMNS